MKKLNKVQIGGIVAGVVVISLITFVIIRRNKNKKLIKQLNDILDGKIKDPNVQSEGQVTITKAELDKLPVGRFPLKFADKNKKVLDLQKLISKKYNVTIDLDGKFGQSTASTLCKNYFKTCFTDIQSRRYEVTEDDFKELSKSANFDGVGGTADSSEFTGGNELDGENILGLDI
jgi:hypothetical protein